MTRVLSAVQAECIAHLPHLGQHSRACEGSLYLAAAWPALKDCLQPSLLSDTVHTACTFHASSS